ncbi:hypothetical protein PsorP6_013218 [Peronosclerospora sorghi]|uniref:Uncharacterized protein n=1 Tax=Peronosclerospora sorghi TaxID=230839 RepID=A0ACC0WFL5_9STRA|nr:hypothetical protein PsorP6_013218 [Peronosclerospora sorghi]
MMTTDENAVTLSPLSIRVGASWTKRKSEGTDEEYPEVYQFIANAVDELAYRLTSQADAPIEFKALFFIGASHTEKFGSARLEPGVCL